MHSADMKNQNETAVGKGDEFVKTLTEFVLRVNLLPNNGRNRIGNAKQVGVHFFLTLLHPQFF